MGQAILSDGISIQTDGIKFNTISYEPFWNTLKNSDETTYTLINNHNISSSTIDRLRKDKAISTTTINTLCKIFNCDVKDICVYKTETIISSSKNNSENIAITNKQVNKQIDKQMLVSDSKYNTDTFVDTYTGEEYNKRYNRLYRELTKLSDEYVTEWKEYFDRHMKLENDYLGIGYQVCQDILSKRKRR